MDLKRGIDKAVEAIVADLAKQSSGSDSEKIKQIASISANNDEVIGDLIAKAFAKVGKEGVITVEEAKGTDTYVDVVEGMQFDRDIFLLILLQFGKNGSRIRNPYILLCMTKVSSLKELLPVLEPVAQSGKPLLILLKMLMELYLHSSKQTSWCFKIAAVKAPGFGDRRKAEDIAILTGGTVNF
jgi:chaperonin GroEL